MDVQEDKYRKTIAEFKSIFSSILTENPIVRKQVFTPTRNLKYIASKALLSDNYPYHNPIFEQAIEEIKNGLNDANPQNKALALRMGRVLPFLFRIKLIERYENEIANSWSRKDKQGGYSYEVAADLSELLLSVFEVTCQNEDIYFDVNQRIISIISRFLESSLQGDKAGLRNACQVLRTIFCYFGYSTTRNDVPDNKLITKIISTFLPSSSFINKQDPALNNSIAKTNNARLLALVLRCRQLEARLKVRELYGFCCLISYFSRTDCELMDLLASEVLEVVENISECDVVLDCFSCLAALVRQDQPYHSRNSILKRWAAVIYEISFKKEYLQYYVFLLDLCSTCQGEVPQRVAYTLAIHCLQITKHLQQQYSRFLIYLRACKIILDITRRSYKVNPQCNLLLRIFQYDWFIDRINQDNDLFKSQFLIALLHHAVSHPETPTPQHLLDLLDISHRLIDWRCTSKEETHIPTLKLAFDMYLVSLGWACRLLEQSGDGGVQRVVEGLVNRCNDPSIYFLFKFKLIGQLLEVKWYKDHHKYLQSKLSFQFIENEIQVVMMPKNPKPIFSYEYSLTYDGEVESRKEIEYIKIIMQLLTSIPKIHEAYSSQIDAIIVDYHRYLSDLEAREDANKELINCLQTLEADYYFNSPQRHFLLAIMPSSPHLQTLNYETNLEEQLLFSSTEGISCEQQVNVFGPMSPVQLSISLHPHPSFSAAYIHIKKNQWVQIQGQLKLLVSSGVQKKERPFQSGILEIKVDRAGALHFQVWKGIDNDLLLGSGSYKIKRRLRWLRADHLRVIDGIHTKAYFKEAEGAQAEVYVSCYYGEPIMMHIMKGDHKVAVGVPNKQIYNEIKDLVPVIVQELFSGTAELIEDRP